MATLKNYFLIAIISIIIALAHYGDGTSVGGTIVIAIGFFIMLFLLASGASKIINALANDYKQKRELK